MSKYWCGLRDGKVVSIQDIPEESKGRACRCICPACHRPLEACSLGAHNKRARYFIIVFEGNVVEDLYVRVKSQRTQRTLGQLLALLAGDKAFHCMVELSHVCDETLVRFTIVKAELFGKGSKVLGQILRTHVLSMIFS